MTQQEIIATPTFMKLEEIRIVLIRTVSFSTVSIKGKKKLSKRKIYSFSSFNTANKLNFIKYSFYDYLINTCTV